MRYYRSLGLCLLFAFGLIHYPQTAAEAVREGFSFCMDTIVPALFPFFVICSLLITMGLPDLLSRPMDPCMRYLFHLPSKAAPAVLLGCLGGYPVGAKTVRQLYEQGYCTKGECERLLSFCNNAGIGFFLGVVGGEVFGRPAVGFSLWGIHITAAVLIGILLRSRECPRRESESLSLTCFPSLASALTQSVSGALSSILGVCAFILFFCVALSLLEVSGILGLLSLLLQTVSHCSSRQAEALLRGICELTAGLSHLSPDRNGFLLASVLFGFGGFSVHGQTVAVLGESGLSLRRYWLGKTGQSLLSLLLALPVSHLLGF